MYELRITDHIAAAHFLRGYDGPCKDLHGHTWKVEVSLQSGELNAIGLVADFRDLKQRLKKYLNKFDHVNLNDLPEFQDVNPSTEHLARVVYQEFQKECAPLTLQKVRVWESDTASVTYFEHTGT